MSIAKQRNSANTLIDKVRTVSAKDYEDFIDNLLKTRTPVTIGFLNQHAYNVANQNSMNLLAFSNLDCLLRDGIGIKLACLYKKTSPGANMNGTDFIPAVVNRAIATDQTVQFYVFGTESPWLEKGSVKLLKGHDCHYLHGFHERERYVETLEKTMAPDALKIIILAMGMPKQENIAWELRKLSRGPTIILCGGAIIDFQAGRFKRAPLVFRRLGLEWFYRLMQEPGRLSSRYMIGIPKFFLHVLRNER